MIRIAELINRNNDFLYSHKLDADQFKALTRLTICRTPQAQGALYGCDNCESVRFINHSCGHRFCPNCQNYKTTLWLHRQKSRLLPCDYFMITFTLPAELRKVSRKDRRAFYDAFFDCTSAAIKEMAWDRLKGAPGMVGVLHTNGRNLSFHPHIHYIVPAIVLNKNEKSIKKIKAKFFLHQQVLANLFRGKFLSKLKELKIPFPGYLYGRKWQADCDLKGNGINALEYLSRYLIKGPVSQKALSYTANDSVKLRYKDSDKKKMTSITFDQRTFLKQLVQHVLPKGFRRVREYGFLAPAGKKMLLRLQLILRVKLPDDEVPEPPKVTCPCCQSSMRIILQKVGAEFILKMKKRARKSRSPPKVFIG
ncbi:MAG: transposase [Flavobacteriaceae bacterium]|nr:transposase [Flavobacteriaceae bacterium]